MDGKFNIAGIPPSYHAPRLELAASVGVGPKQEHINALMANPTSVDFIEIHAENFMTPGPNIELLSEAAKNWPLSIHGVAMSLGGDDPIDRVHLSCLKNLIDAVNPALVSEHIAWSRHGGTYFNDLLPVAYNKQSSNRFCDRIHEVQQYLGRKILLENPSTYVRFHSDTMHEADFLTELVHRTGCGILLDINNLYVSAQNHGWDAKDWISRIQPEAVGEIHLAGHEQNQDDNGDSVLIDTHGEKVSEPVWVLYSEFLALAGPRPTLIERDNNIPPFEDLKQEVEFAKFLMHAEMGEPT